MERFRNMLNDLHGAFRGKSVKGVVDVETCVSLCFSPDLPCLRVKIADMVSVQLFK